MKEVIQNLQIVLDWVLNMKQPMEPTITISTLLGDVIQYLKTFPTGVTALQYTRFTIPRGPHKGIEGKVLREAWYKKERYYLITTYTGQACHILCKKSDCI